nr:AAA family ATPase [Natronobiforma cellulositropha]
MSEEFDRLEFLLEAYIESTVDARLETPGAPTPYLSEKQARPILERAREQLTWNRALIDEFDERTATVEARLECSRESGHTSRLARLRAACGLSRLETDLLVLALAPDRYDNYGDLYAALRETVPPAQPTVGLLSRVLTPVAREGELESAFAASAPLRRYGLIEPFPEAHAGGWRSQPVAVDAHVSAYLAGHDGLDPALADVASLEEATATADSLALAPETADRLVSLRDDVAGPRVYSFYGPAGAGAARAPAAVCPAETPLLRGDLPALIADGRFERFCREAALHEAAVVLENADESPLAAGRRGRHRRRRDDDTAPAEAVPAFDREAFFETLDRFPNDVFVIGETRWVPDAERSNHGFVSLEFPRPDYELRRECWDRHAEVLPDGVTPADLAAVFDLTQLEIERTAAAVRALAESRPDGTALTRTDVYESCKTQSASRLGELAEHIDPNYTWEDIVLPETTARQLRDVATHIVERGTVYAEWGFGRRFGRGQGVVALFSGPSGTGKTMAAEILATDSGLDLYKIDLSSVVSKYIGETEENLERIFEEAERSNAILLFDEADAVFGERSSVSDSTDRYANVEVNYLLQRIERYDGVVILTTNYESNIDDAFQRRIHLSVDFSLPEETHRETLWRLVFPEEAPVSDLDYEFLATFELSGGDVKNAAQAAAFMAAGADEASAAGDDGDGTRAITMAHVVTAIKREYEKKGRLIDASRFEPYQELLE